MGAEGFFPMVSYVLITVCMFNISPWSDHWRSLLTDLVLPQVVTVVCKVSFVDTCDTSRAIQNPQKSPRGFFFDFIHPSICWFIQFHYSDIPQGVRFTVYFWRVYSILCAPAIAGSQSRSWSFEEGGCDEGYGPGSYGRESGYWSSKFMSSLILPKIIRYG